MPGVVSMAAYLVMVFVCYNVDYQNAFCNGCSPWQLLHPPSQHVSIVHGHLYLHDDPDGNYLQLLFTVQVLIISGTPLCVCRLADASWAKSSTSVRLYGQTNVKP